MFASTFILLLEISLQLSSSLGSCSSPVFSVCWVINVSALVKRPDIKVWLDNRDLTPIGSPGKFVSLSITPLDVHTLRTEYEGISQVWNFSIVSGAISVSDAQRTASLSTSRTVEALKVFKQNEVFPCENNTLYLYQKEDFIVTFGYTHRFPLRAESWDASSLWVSWRGSPHDPTDPPHVVTLYRPDPDGLVVLCHNDTTRASRYRFSGLEGCRDYTACVATAGSPSVLCLDALTDPDVPENFRLTRWDSSSLTLEWDPAPSHRTLHGASFAVTVLQLDASGRVLEEAWYGRELDQCAFSLGSLPPCCRVRLGLQAVCRSRGRTRRSRMLLNDGNSAHSEIVDLRQTSSGPHRYTVSWSVWNVSSISSFRVYHQGELRSSTLLTSHTVTGLLPCQQYSCRVEGLCGDSTVMSVSTIQTKTGPGDVSDLRFRQKDSLALWSGASGAGVSFLYHLCESGSPTVRKGRLAGPPLPLLGLKAGTPYELEVVPECKGGERGAPSVLHFVTDGVPGNDPNDEPGDKSSGTPTDILHPRVVNSTAQTTDRLGPEVNLPSHEMFLVVPWTLPPLLEDLTAEPRVKLEGVIKHKLENLLGKFRPKVEVQLILFEDLEKTKTKITFESFDVSSQDGVASLHPEEQLQYITALDHPLVTVTQGGLYWQDLDECSDSALNECDYNSLCINTLDSFTCVCKPGYYNLSPFLSPACHEKGMFTLCQNGEVSGGISKSFLLRHFGGNVTASLNDGSCSVNETDEFYYYRITGAPSRCGGQTVLNLTHVALRNTLTVTLGSESSVTRRDLKVVWACTYPLLQTQTAHMKPGLDWFSSHSVVQVNSSRLLEISMALYTDSSYEYNYTGPVELPSSERLYIQVALHCEDSLAYDMSLQLESCWATETANPQEEKRAFLLRMGCPKDSTFHWYLQDDAPRRRRFSVQMFTMSDHTHIYLHCLARICSQDENCATNCSAKESGRVRRDLPDKLTAIVSAGPISVATRSLSNWAAVQILLSVGGGLIGLFVLAVLGARASQVIAEHNQCQ